MNENRQEIVLFRIERKIGLLMLGAAAIFLGGFALAEQLTITTSYPVPSAIYTRLVTTGQSIVNSNIDSTFNRNGGNTLLVPNATHPGGKVGIGALDPSSTGKLQVAGTADVTNLQVNGIAVADAVCASDGLVARDAAGLLLSCQSLVWKPAMGGGSSNFGGYVFRITGQPASIRFYGTGTYSVDASTFSGTLLCDPATTSGYCGLYGNYWCGADGSCAWNYAGSPTPRGVVGVAELPVASVVQRW